MFAFTKHLCKRIHVDNVSPHSVPSRYLFHTLVIRMSRMCLNVSVKQLEKKKENHQQFSLFHLLIQFYIVDIFSHTHFKLNIGTSVKFVVVKSYQHNIIKMHPFLGSRSTRV